LRHKNAQKSKATHKAAPKSVPGMRNKTVEYTIPNKKKRKDMRREFNNHVRKDFLKHLAAKEESSLVAAGISKAAITAMKAGRTPAGFNTHHKLPIHGGGTNDFKNLILIKDKPYHDEIHRVLTPQVSGMAAGDSRTVKIPTPGGNVFVPNEKHKELETKKRKKHGALTSLALASKLIEHGQKQKTR
jgi:hypothetical protein